MITSIILYNQKSTNEIPFSFLNNYKIIIYKSINLSESFTLKIQFTNSIVQFRNHDYSWADLSENRIAPEFTSKILKLKDGTFVQPNANIGIWEVKKENPNQLIWKFNPQFSNPLTKYSGKNNVKKIVAANTNIESKIDLSLLFFKNNALEISRSKIPFSAIACFTDHCDYDTLENLKVQRKLFNDLNIKTTKGFFLNHFSKRTDNASVENDKQEIEEWLNDGHELAYHSLSQSIKSTEESFEDFKNFNPPFNEIPVWIDHGFQPYNLSFYKNNGLSNDDFSAVLKKNNIHILWNYIDCGIASKNVINQLNPSQFTLANYWKSLDGFSIKTKFVKLIKAIIFHFDNNENRVRNYIDSISAIRGLLKKKNPNEIVNFIKNIFPVSIMVLKTLITWNSLKNIPFKVAKYAPIVFNHDINNASFSIFQTIELVDFINGLSKTNIDLLEKENGLIIAHTYFSVDMKHHQGKLFKNENTLDEKVVENFEYLSQKISQKAIWNPTVTELIEHFQKYKSTIFDIDEKGAVFIKNNFNIPSRTIQ